MPNHFLRDLIILLALSVAAATVMARLRTPSVVGFLAAGVLAGPAGLGLISDTGHVAQLAEAGVVLLLFTIGMEFSLSELVRIRRQAFLGGGLQMALTTAIVAAVAWTAGASPGCAVFLGLIVSLSSTAVLMKLLMDRGESDSPQGRLSLGILIFQDLCVVPLMLFVPLLAGKGGGIVDLVSTTLKAAAVVAVAHVVARFVIPLIFRQVAATRSREIFLIAILLFCFGSAWITSKAGLSLAIGAFIAGLAIAESEYAHQALGDMIPFRDAFMALFFTSAGMLLDPALLAAKWWPVFLLVVAVIAVKSGAATTAALVLGMPPGIAVTTGCYLSQVGEFSFVLSQEGMRQGFLSTTSYEIFIAASVATMALTPLIMKGGALAGEVVGRNFPLPPGRKPEEQKESLREHIIIAGYGHAGRSLARSLGELGIPYVIVDSNPFTVRAEKGGGERIIFGDISNHEILRQAGAGEARMLVAAVNDPSGVRRMVVEAKRVNPVIHLIVRSRYLLETEPLVKLGADEVVPEEFETSVEIVSRVLHTYMVPHHRIEECIDRIREGSYRMLRTPERTELSRHIGTFLSAAEVGTFEVRRGAPLDGHGMRDADPGQAAGATLLAIKRGEKVTVNPGPEFVLREGDVALMLGNIAQLRRVEEMFEGEE